MNTHPAAWLPGSQKPLHRLFILLLGLAVLGCGPDSLTVEPDGGVVPPADTGIPQADARQDSRLPPPRMEYAGQTPRINEQTLPRQKTKFQGPVCEGYNLAYLANANGIFKPVTVLTDMSGKVINKWSLIGQPAKLLSNGSILGGRGFRTGAWDFELEELVQQSWDGKDQWTFSKWDDDGTGKLMSRWHHDFAREGNPTGYYAPGQDDLPQGKTLVLAHKKRMVPSVSKYELVDDVIYELDYKGLLTGYTWYAADHVVDMGFTELALDSIYHYPGHAETDMGDWLHINSISYLGKNPWYEKTKDERFNPENIIFCSREANFVAIISRKTGDLVWRVGPDNIPGQPGYEIDQLVGPHHAHMIPYGLPGAGNILIYDNGGNSGYGAGSAYKYGRGFTRIAEVDPVSLKMIWEYQHPKNPNDFISPFMGGAQRLPNGNTLITHGQGYAFEVNKKYQTVWQLSTFDIAGDFNFLYRVYRIPPDWLPAGKNTAGYQTWSTGGCALLPQNATPN